MNVDMAPGISLDDGKAWDDSALIDSWDEAVNEYTKYHSIQRSGKRLEDVLDQDELEQLRREHGDVLGEAADTSSSNADQNIDPEAKDADVLGEMANSKKVMSVDQAHAEVPSPCSGQQASAATAQTTMAQASSAPSAMPQALLGNVPDENMRNLMMSWYYAGYYTGLHAGQQAAKPSDSTASK